MLRSAIAPAWIRVHPARSVLWPLLQLPRPAAFHHTLVERRRRGPHRPRPHLVRPALLVELSGRGIGILHRLSGVTGGRHDGALTLQLELQVGRLAARALGKGCTAHEPGGGADWT